MNKEIVDARATFCFDQGKPNECSEWLGPIDGDGYGTFHSGRSFRAHVWMVLSQGRKIPAGYHVHHECNNRSCVNPVHLVVLSPGEHSKISFAEVHRKNRTETFC